MSTRIRRAVQDFLRLSHHSTAPLRDLTEFTERLRDEPDWTEGDIRTFRTRIVRLLRRIREDRRDAA